MTWEQALIQAETHLREHGWWGHELAVILDAVAEEIMRGHELAEDRK